MATLAHLAVTLSANISNFQSNLNAAQQATQTFSSQLQSIGSGVTMAGGALTLGLTAPIAAFGVSAVKTAADFDSAMNTVAARSGATGEELGKLREQAKELGADTSFSAMEAAGAMTELAAAGLKTTDIMSAMPGMLDLAAAGQLGLADAAGLSVNVMSQFGMEAKDFGHIGDVLVQAANDSTISVAEMGESMKYAGAIAKAAGWSFEEVSAGIALMGNAGVKGSQAGTTFRGALAALYNQSNRTRDALKELGVNVFDSNGKMKSLTQIVTELGAAGADVGDIIQIFGTEAATGIQALVAQGGPALDSLTQKYKVLEGAAAANADVMTKGLNGALQSLSGAWETLKINIAEAGILDAVTDLVKGLAEVIAQIGKADKTTLKFIIGLGLFAAALGPVVMGIGMMLSMLGLLLPVAGALGVSLGALIGIIAGIGVAIVALGAGLVALAYFVTTHWEEIKSAFAAGAAAVVEFLSGTWEMIKTGWGNILSWVVGIVATLISTVVDGWTKIGEWVAGIVLTLVRTVIDGWTNIWHGLTLLNDKITSGIQAAWGRITAFVKRGWDLLVAIFDGRLLAAVRGVFGNVLNYLGSLAVRFIERGRDLVRRIVQGIASAIRSLPGGGPIANWLSNAVGSGSSAAHQAGLSAGAAYSAGVTAAMASSTYGSVGFRPATFSSATIPAGPSLSASSGAGSLASRGPAQVVNHFHVAAISVDAKDKTASQAVNEILAELQARAQAQLGDSMRWAEVQ